MRRVISFLLSIVMVFSMLPVSAFATDVQTEETAAVTETVEETTSPVTEETGEPSMEAAMEPSTEAATEAVTEAVTEPAEETAPEPSAEQGTYVPTVSLADSDELLEGWLYRQFYGDSGVSFFGVAASAQLNTYGKKLYDGLKAAIQAVAAGSQTSTVFEVDVSGAGATDINDFQLNQVIDALLHDCPYELYWYDKTDFTTYQYTQTSDGVIYSIIVTMPVVSDLRGSGYTEDAPVADVSLAAEAADAAAAAQEIVAANAGKSVYEKIVAFKGEICDLTSYNDDAAAGMDFSTDADPWQLLWVFDGDSSTKVVCEGYSKAFQYLCDLDGTIDCYTVTGVMTSPSVSGGHMWNIVTLNGANYLVDVTNSDSGTAGDDGSLFLNGGTGSVAAGYTFSTGGGNILFTYDDAMITLWGSDGILVLSETAYDPASVPEETEPEETVPEETEPEETDPVETEPVAALTGTCGDSACWEFDESTGTLTISGSGAMDDRGDQAPWAVHNSNIVNVVIEEGITYIGEKLFQMNDSIQSVTIADSVTDIGGVAFYMCCGLEELNLGNGVQIIGSGAFEHCCALTSLILPNSVTTLESYAISSCHGLTEITIPAGVTSIAEYALGACSTMETVTFEGLPAAIDANAFGYTEATVYYPANAGWTDAMLQNYGGTLTWVAEEPMEPLEPEVVGSGNCGDDLFWTLDEEGTLTISGTGEMYDYDQLSNRAPWYGSHAIKKLIMEDGVTTIGDSAFAHSSDLTDVTIPDSVTVIGPAAFWECSTLAEITIPDSVTTIGSHAFGGCLLTSITIPASVTSIGVDLFDGCYNLASILVAEESQSFTSLDGVLYDKDLTVLHAYPTAKEGTEYTIPDGVMVISDSAFQFCEELTEIIIPDTVTTIGEYAFDYCRGLTSIDIPYGVVTIGSHAFGACNKLTSIVIPDSVTSIGNGAFSDCANLVSVTIPDSVTKIDNYAFSFCSSLTSVAIPAGITSIGEGLFRCCYDLSSVTLPDGVTSIGSWAFYDCCNLTEINIPEAVTSIGQSAFGSCYELCNIVIPAGVTSIENNTFSFCESLTSVVIPAGVTSVGDWAFGNCKNLSEIVFEGSAPTFAGDGQQFYSVTATVYYPADDATWTSDVMLDYGGTLTWEANESLEPIEPTATEPEEEEFYTVTFVNNYLSMPEEHIYSYTDGMIVSELPGAPDVDGYSFVGWFSEEEGAGAQLSLGDTWYAGMATTWYAYYESMEPIEPTATEPEEEEFYTVTFVNNYLSMPEEHIYSYTDGMIVSELPGAPDVDGYSFVGWFSGENGAGTQLSQGDTWYATMSAVWYAYYEEAGETGPMTQAEFEAAIAEAASYYEDYYLTRPVELTTYLDIDEGINVIVAEGGSITVQSSILHMVSGSCLVIDGGDVTVNGTLRVDYSGLNVKCGTLTVNGTLSMAQGAGFLTMGTSTVTGVDTTLFNAYAYPTTSAELAQYLTDAANYNNVYVNQFQSFVLEQDITIADNIQWSLSWQSEEDEVTVIVPEGITVTNNGTILVGKPNTLVVNAGGTLVNNSLMNISGVYNNYGTEINNGTISREIYNAAGLNSALAAAQEGDNVFLQSSLTLADGDYITVPNGVSLYLNGGLTVPSGALLYIGTDAVLSSNQLLDIQSGAALHNYGTIEINAGTFNMYGSIYGNGAFKQSGGTINGIDKSQIIYSIWFSAETEAELLACIAEAEGYAGFCIDGYWPDTLTITGDLEIPEGSSLTIGSGRELIIDTGASLTINGELKIGGYAQLTVKDGATAVCNGTITNGGTVSGSIEGYSLSQEAFEAALSEAIAAGTQYYLRQPVILTSDFVWNGGTTLFICDGGSITVPAGVTMTVNSQYNMVIMLDGAVTVQANGMLAVPNEMGMQFTQGTLTMESGALLNSTVGGICVTLGRGSVNGIDPAMVEANAYPTTADELAAACDQGAAYSAIRVTLENSITLDRDITIPENGQLDFYNYNGEEVLLTVPSGRTLTNNGFVNINAGYGIVVEAGGTLVNNLYIGVNGGIYTNNGTEVNNGTINIVRNITNAEELILALEEAGAQASQENYPHVYLRNPVTLEASDHVVIPSYVTLMLNDCLTMESGSSVTIQQAATLMTGIYNSDALIVKSGASMLNYGQLYLNAGYATFAEGTYTQYQGGMVDLYPDATADGLDKGLIDYNISFSTAEELERGLTQAQLGEYGSYTLSVAYGTASVTLSGSYEIPANTTVDIYNGTNLELLSGTDVTNYGTIYLFSGAILTIPEDALLTNNGTIYNYGGTINGTVTGNQPGTGGYNETITVADPDSLKAELEADSGTDICLSGEIALTANLTVNSSSAVCIPGGASLVVPSGKTLTIKSNVYIYGGSIVIEKGGKLVISGDGWIQNLSGVIANEGTVTVSASSGGIWEYISYGASSTGIDKSKLHGIVFAQSTDDVLNGLAAAAEGYSMVEIVAENSFTLTESVTIPENAAFEVACFDAPVTVTIPWGITLTNEGNVLIFENSGLWVRLGGGLVNNGYMEVWGTYTNNGTHSGGDPIVTDNGFVDIGAPGCGDDLTYDFENGVLTVSGTGDMYDYANEMAPWYDGDAHLLITEVVIEEGVTSISHSAFALCSNLERVSIASTVTSIGGYAFQGCTALTEILFRGGAPEINSTAFTGVTAAVYYPGADSSWTGDKLMNYGGNLNWVPEYDLDQSALDSLIDNAPVNGDGSPIVSQDITIAEDTVLFRDGMQVIFAGDITVPAGVTLMIHSNVLLTGRLTVAEGGAVVAENPDPTGESWVMLVDCGGAEINGTLAVNGNCSFRTNDGAEAIIGQTGVVNNYGTFCAEANGFITVEGIVNNHNHLSVYNYMTVSGIVNNFGYAAVEAVGAGEMILDGTLVNNGELVIHAGANLQLNGVLNNHGFLHHYKAEEGAEAGLLLLNGTLLNDTTGELYIWDEAILQGTLENYGYVNVSGILQVEPTGILHNSNGAVDDHGYVIVSSSGELMVSGRLSGDGDMDNFGIVRINGGEMNIDGVMCNNGSLSIGNSSGSTMNVNGTLTNCGDFYIHGSEDDEELAGGCLNVGGALIAEDGTVTINGVASVSGVLLNQDGGFAVYGESASLTMENGAYLVSSSGLLISEGGQLVVGDNVQIDVTQLVRLDVRGSIVGLDEEYIQLFAVVYCTEELAWALQEASTHQYGHELIQILDSITFEGVVQDAGSVDTVLVVPEGTRLCVVPYCGEVVFADGTTLINNGSITIGHMATLIIAENAVLENNGSINPYDGWLVVDGQQTGEGTVDVPEEVWVTTETELHAAVAMGVKTIYVQSAASYAARTVSTLTLTKDLTIPAGTKVILLGAALSVPETVTLTVEGSMVITDGGAVTVDGTLENNAVNDTGLCLESGSLTFGETGVYAEAEGAEVIVGKDFAITGSGEEAPIPDSSITRKYWVTNYAYLQELLAAVESDARYQIQVNSSFPIEGDVTIPANVELIILEGVTLSVPARIYLYNQGTITVQNWAELYISGQYSYVELGGTVDVAENGRFTQEFPQAESITLYADGNPGNVTVGVGETVELTAEVLPAMAADQELIWELEGSAAEWSDYEARQLRAVEAGEAIVRVTATDGTGLSAEITVTVTDFGIQITADSNRVLGGKSIKLTADWIPENDTGTSIVWSLENGGGSFAKLSAKGNTATVTALDVTERQTVTVLAEAKDGSADPARFQLTIIPKAKSITLFDATDGYDGSLPEGMLLDEDFNADQPMILKAMVDPAGASAEISWKAFNPDVACIVEDETLDAGCVYVYFTGKAGKAKFTAATTDGSKLTATWNTSVVEPVSIEAAGDTELELTAGQTVTLKINNADTGRAINAKYIDWYIADATDADGNWLSDYASVLDAKGKLTTGNVISYERLTIYGDVNMDGCHMGDVIYTIEVYPKTTTVELYQGNELVNGKTLALDSSAEYPSLKLSALQLPLDAKDGISWKSSSERIATVQNGVVTFAGKTGTVTITATADDSGKKATVKVEVGAMTREITAGVPAATLLSGKSMTLTAETVPAKPTKSGVTWTIIEGDEYAKVSGSKLTAKTVAAPQEVTLIATSKDAARVVSNPVTVTILPKTAETLNLMLDGELVTKTTLNAGEGDTFQLSAWMFFSDLAKDEQLTDVTWVSKKPAVATVSTAKDVKSATTTVTVVGTGSTVITATGKNSEGKTVTATVTIKSGILSEGVKVTSDVFTVGSGKSITLKAETIPAKPTTRGVVWSLAEGDEAYAKLSSSGKLTAAKGLNSAQTVTVIVQAKDGASAPVEIPVTITPLATGVELFLYGDNKVTGQTAEWSVLDELKLTAKVYPFFDYGVNRGRNAAQSVTWKSSNSKILSIDARTGEVTFGTKTGTVTITATANDGSGKKAAFKVKTFMPITELEVRDGHIAGGKTLKLSTLTEKINADATSKKLLYSIMGGDGMPFVTLSNGQLKTKKVTSPKTVQLYVWDEYGYVMDSFAVTITPATTKVNLETLVDGEFVNVNGKTLELEEGRMIQVRAVSDPSFALADYTWKTSNAGHAGICIYDENGEKSLAATRTGGNILLEGVTPGKTVTITATANDGTGVKATVKVKIIERKPE